MHLLEGRRKRFITKAMSRAGNSFLLRGRMSGFSSQIFSLACCFVTTKHQMGLRKSVWCEMLRHLHPSSSLPPKVEGDLPQFKGNLPLNCFHFTRRKIIDNFLGHKCFTLRSTLSFLCVSKHPRVGLMLTQPLQRASQLQDLSAPSFPRRSGNL